MHKEIVVSLFLFHAFSVFVWAIPARADDPFFSAMRHRVRPMVGWYILSTGQWQNWNVFSPDPVPTLKEFVIDIVESDKIIQTVSLTPDGLTWRERTNTLKLLSNFSGEEKEFAQARSQLLLSLCRRWNLPALHELHLRLRTVDFVNNSTSEKSDVLVRCL